MDATGRAGEEGTFPGRLDDRIVRLLEESSGHLAFNGLRRALQAHPESLSRALRRLERVGVLQRDAGGYALSGASELHPDDRPEVPPRVIATVEIPLGRTGEEILGQLAGRWLGGLRWVGVYDRPGDPWLVWSVEGSQGHVLASVEGRSFKVSVDGDVDDPAGILVDAGRELLGYGVGQWTRPSRTRPFPVRGFELATPPRVFGPN